MIWAIRLKFRDCLFTLLLPLYLGDRFDFLYSPPPLLAFREVDLFYHRIWMNIRVYCLVIVIVKVIYFN